MSLTIAAATRQALRSACILAIALAAVHAGPPVAAQDTDPGIVAPGTWQAHPAMRRAQAVTSGDGAMWGGTDGGLFRYDVDSGELRRFTTVDGLANLDIWSLAFDAPRGNVWIGYSDGVLDRLDAASGEVRTFYDIARADRYPQRGINRLRVIGDSLMIATDFGVVVFDLDRNEVRDTYDKFSAFDRGQPVFDVIAAPLVNGQPGLWVATRDGVTSAPRDAPNLRLPSAWTIDELAPAPALALAYYDGRMHLGKQETPGEPIAVGDTWRRQPNGSWTRQFTADQSVPDLVADGDFLYVVSDFFVWKIRPDGTRSGSSVRDVVRMLGGAIGPDGRLWVGSFFIGLVQLPPLDTVDGPITADKSIVPSGPLANEVLSLDVGRDGDVWIGYFPRFGLISGMGRFDGVWTNFSHRDGLDVPQAPIRDIMVDSHGRAWGASDGDGLMRVDPDGSVVTYRSDNSTLRGEPGSPHFIVTLGVDEDSRGRVWVTNRNAQHILHVFSEEDGWTGIDRPAQTPPAASRVRDVYVDSFDQKWVSLLNTGHAGGNGFMVVRTDPDDPTVTEAVSVIGSGSPTTGTGLPHQSVRAFAQDLDGRMWIGTERGLATIFSPGSVVASPGLAQPTWARTPDQASYFLRDLSIFAIAVDPSGGKWLASSSGVWLLNAAGNEVEAHFTAENSPLPSDVVVDVAVDGASGTVWFATAAGVMSYRGVSVDPALRAERLRVYPNPYRPEHDPFVRFEGLVAETRIRVLTVDGQVVASFDGRGGAATWDGRDQRTGQMVPSGVYLVAAAGTNGEGTAYGKIAVIR